MLIVGCYRSTMLSRASIAAVATRRLGSLTLSRHIGVSAACCQTAASKSSVDPIQKLFVDKIHEYVNKSKLVIPRSYCKQFN